MQSMQLKNIVLAVMLVFTFAFSNMAEAKKKSGKKASISKSEKKSKKIAKKDKKKKKQKLAKADKKKKDRSVASEKKKSKPKKKKKSARA